MIKVNDICIERGIKKEDIEQLIEQKKFLPKEISFDGEECSIERDAVLRELGTVEIYKSDYRDKLAFAVIRREEKLVFYKPEYITPITNQLGEQVAKALLQDGERSDAIEEVVLAFYIFEKKEGGVPWDVKYQISTGKGFAGGCSESIWEEVRCQAVRLCVNGQGKDLFDIKQFDELRAMVVKDWLRRDILKQDIALIANGIKVGKAIYKDGYYYPKFNTYPSDTSEKIFLRYQQYIESEECIFDVEVNGKLYRGTLMDAINTKSAEYELQEVRKVELRGEEIFTDMSDKDILKKKYRELRPLAQFDKFEHCKVLLRSLFKEEYEVDHVPLAEYKKII